MIYVSINMKQTLKGIANSELEEETLPLFPAHII